MRESNRRWWHLFGKKYDYTSTSHLIPNYIPVFPLLVLDTTLYIFVLTLGYKSGPDSTLHRWLTSQRATRFLGMSGANGESMGCLGACCQLWEEWRSGGLPGRGDTCLQQSWKKWACWGNKVREPRFRQREGVESAEVQSQAGFVWWNWLLSWWAYKNFLCVRVLISMHSVYFLLYHLTLILFIMLFV